MNTLLDRLCDALDAELLRQETVLARIAGPGSGVRWLGEVSDDRLAELYRGSVVVQPSLHEGFDMPLAEALAAGAAVVVSDIPVHREVAGDAALYAPPEDARALSAAIGQVLAWGLEERRAQAARARRRALELGRCDPVAEHVAVYRALTEHRSGAVRP